MAILLNYLRCGPGLGDDLSFDIWVSGVQFPAGPQLVGVID